MKFSRVSVLALAMLGALPARALDIQALWDFRQPALSEQRFRAALETLPPASDEALILQTQIARSLGLRRDFELAIQLRLARENEAAGTPGAFVFEELELLYRVKGDAAEAARQAERGKQIRAAAAG